MAVATWITNTAYKKSETEFSDQSTDSNGLISEQTVEFTRWTGTSEDPLMRIHKYTFSKAGFYDTLVYENQFTNSSIKWNIELKQHTQSPKAVEHGV